MSSPILAPELTMSSPELEAPFYGPDGLVNDFLEHSPMYPGRLEGYRTLESTVSGALMDQFGEYMSDQQRDYLRKPQIAFLSPEDAEIFSDHWGESVSNINAFDTSIEGVLHMSYMVGGTEGDAVEAGKKTAAIQHWAGRIAVFPLADDEASYRVGPKHLMSEQAFSHKMMREAAPSIEEFVYSTAGGATMVHEKTHGIQDPRLPLPFLEAAATFYERVVFQAQDWDWRAANNTNLTELADLYAGCVAEYGPDIHRLTFGNLPNVARKLALEYIKDRFTLAEIERRSTAGDNPARYVHWVTTPAFERQDRHELVAA